MVLTFRDPLKNWLCQHWSYVTSTATCQGGEPPTNCEMSFVVFFKALFYLNAWYQFWDIFLLQCCKVTGDDSLSAEELKQRIKGDDFYIFVVTPDIIKNYFLTSREASLCDFTLLIFDEVHHTKKKHSYNRVLNMYKKARIAGTIGLPQVDLIVTHFIHKLWSLVLHYFLWLGIVYLVYCE